MLLLQKRFHEGALLAVALNEEALYEIMKLSDAMNKRRGILKVGRKSWEPLFGHHC
jgi:hypothetical protein